MPRFKELFETLAPRAAESGVRLAFENCATAHAPSDLVAPLSLDHAQLARRLIAVADDAMSMHVLTVPDARIR